MGQHESRPGLGGNNRAKNRSSREGRLSRRRIPPISQYIRYKTITHVFSVSLPTCLPTIVIPARLQSVRRSSNAGANPGGSIYIRHQAAERGQRIGLAALSSARCHATIHRWSFGLLVAWVLLIAGPDSQATNRPVGRGLSWIASVVLGPIENFRDSKCCGTAT